MTHRLYFKSMFLGLGVLSAQAVLGQALLNENFDNETTDSLITKGWVFGKNDKATEVGTEFVVAPPYATADPDTGEGGAPGGSFKDPDGNTFVHPPTADGTASTGKYLISDSDTASGSDNIGSDSQFFAITPAFSTVGLSTVWFHADTDITQNNNGEEMMDLMATVDDGATWIPVWQAAAPQRPIKAFNFNQNTDPDYSGSADLNGYPVLGSGSHTKIWSGIHGRWHLPLPTAVLNKPAVKLRIRYLDPSDAWWIAIDNLVVDTNPPPQGNTVVLLEGFEQGIPSSWKNTPVLSRKWSTEPLKNAEGKFIRTVKEVGADEVEFDRPIHTDILREIEARRAVGTNLPPAAVERLGVQDFLDFPALLTLHPNGLIDGRMIMMLAGGNYVMWQDGPDENGPEGADLDLPAMDFSDATGVYIDYDSEWITDSDDSRHAVMVSVDGGATFTRIRTHEGALANRDEASNFMHDYLAVPQAAGKKNVIFRFHVEGTDSDIEGFWVLDNVRITADKAAVPPTISATSDSQGNLVITFTGTLQSSGTLGGAFNNVVGATSPFVVPKAELSSQQLYRSSN